MATLSRRQLEDVRFAVSMVTDGYSTLEPILMVGDKGAGKRTIATEIAAELGLQFVEFSVRGSEQQTLVGLFGSESAARRADEGTGAPGELGASEPTLLYLSGFQSISSEVTQPLYQALKTRRYLDPAGNGWRLSANLLIVGAMTLQEEDSTVSEEHFICGAFRRRLEVILPTGTEDLSTISDAIWSDYIRDQPSDGGTRLLFPFVRVAHDGLHSLRRWIGILAKMTFRGDTISSAQIALLPSMDLRHLAGKIEYRGKTLDIVALQAWFSQFPESLRPVAWTLIRHISVSYYVGGNRYFEALRGCAIQSGIPSGSRVCFCRSQELGKSGPRVTHELKNLANWKTDRELDLTLQAPNWEEVSHHRWFVLADDFVGSGKTLHGIIEGAIKPLLKTFPDAQVRILIVAGFRAGIQRCVDDLHDWRSRARIIPGILFGDEDRCFSSRSRILQADSQREALRGFCTEIAQLHFPGLWQRGHHLGWNELAALVVFSDTVPNNTLPILWFRSKSWNPIFPASELI